MKDRILVIGGYGQVGKIICKHLAAIFPGKIVAAGRSYRKAESFASSLKGIVLPLQLDIYDPDSMAGILQNTRLVIMCLDQKDDRFVRACIESKVHYIDISPSYKTLTRIEALSERAAASDVTLILGVGLAPGVSNMLVKYIASRCDSIMKANLYLMLGTGEKHGRDGIGWLLNHIRHDFYVVKRGVLKRVKSFSDHKKTVFPDPLGKRMAYRFDIADQHIVPKTLGVASASTRFCYDSALVTHYVALLKAVGLFNLLESHFLKIKILDLFELLLGLFSKLGLGSDVYSVKVDAAVEKNKRQTTMCASIIGNNNTLLTGVVAMLAAQKIYSYPHAPGVHYLEQLFAPEELLPKLSPYIRFNFTEGDDG